MTKWICSDNGFRLWFIPSAFIQWPRWVLMPLAINFLFLSICLPCQQIYTLHWFSPIPSLLEMSLLSLVPLKGCQLPLGTAERRSHSLWGQLMFTWTRQLTSKPWNCAVSLWDQWSRQAPRYAYVDLCGGFFIIRDDVCVCVCLWVCVCWTNNQNLRTKKPGAPTANQFQSSSCVCKLVC